MCRESHAEVRETDRLHHIVNALETRSQRGPTGDQGVDSTCASDRAAPDESIVGRTQKRVPGVRTLAAAACRVQTADDTGQLLSSKLGVTLHPCLHARTFRTLSPKSQIVATIELCRNTRHPPILRFTRMVALAGEAYGTHLPSKVNRVQWFPVDGTTSEVRRCSQPHNYNCYGEKQCLARSRGRHHGSNVEPVGTSNEPRANPCAPVQLDLLSLIYTAYRICCVPYQL